MSQTPRTSQAIEGDHPYARAAAQLNQLLRRGHSFSGHERNCCYLNLGDGSFANASSVSGLDFADDGRAVAKCDWDFDGDLDLWLANRTSPQVRFMRNEIAGPRRSISFRLRGVRSNRDAIGALVRLGIDDDRRILIQGVRAGEGFLSQSSKTVHFGLGSDELKISSLTVRWPTGRTERFAVPRELAPYHEIVEGSGRVTVWTPPPTSSLPPAPTQTMREPTLAMGSLLTQPVVLPPLRYTAEDGRMHDATAFTNQPVVVNLWATWCQPCLVELAEWSAERKRFAELGARVLAVSVDELAEGHHSRDAFERLRQLQVPFEGGSASSEFVEVLQQVHDLIYDHFRPLPVPTTLLLDQRGRLVGIYKGGVSAQRVVADLRRLEEDAPGLTVLPFRGRWIADPVSLNASLLVARLWDNGLQDEALALVDRFRGPDLEEHQINARLSLATRMKQQGDSAAALEQLRKAYATRPDHVDVNMQLGTELASQGDLHEAIARLKHAISQSDTDRADLYSNLGAALRRADRVEEAEKSLTRAIEIDADTIAAYFNLGLIDAGRGRYEQAAQHFANAVRRDGANASYRINLAMALANLKQFNQAAVQLERVLRNDPEAIAARASLADVYARQGNVSKAMAQFREILRREPKASRIWFRMGQVSEEQGRHQQALEAYRIVDALSPGDPRVWSRIAWILATSPHGELRDGAKAVRFAESAVQKTNRQQPMALDVLAAAHAEMGQFQLALRVLDEAVELLDAERDRVYRAELAARASRYRQKQPFRSAKNDVR